MKIEIFKGDITSMQIEAIVNAANSSLLGGGGVDGAIHRKAGPDLLTECIKIRDRQGGCKTGHAVITRAGNLDAKFVIHAVGPVWSGGKNGERNLLYQTYQSVLELCVRHDIKEVAIPNISTGIYKFPKKEACKMVFQVLEKFKEKQKINRLVFVCFDEENERLYQKERDTFQLKN